MTNSASLTSLPLKAEEDEATTLNGLSDDLIVEVLCWVPPMDLLRSVALVSKRFAAAVRNDAMWRFHSSSLVQANNSLTQHQLQRCCLFSAAATEVPKCLELGSVLVPRECAESLVKRQQHWKNAGTNAAVCLASTTDNKVEHIGSVLLENEANDDDDWILIRDPPVLPPIRPLIVWRRNNKYWSSRESPTQETNETLLFTTRYPLALISEIGIKPFTDITGQTYTWKHMVIKVYHLQVGAKGVLLDPNPPEPCSGFPCTVPQTRPKDASVLRDKAIPDEDTIHALLENQEPTYQSLVLDTPSPEVDSWQHFDLPPGGVVGNVVTITLIGKNYRQFQNSGYYVCVERVAVRGIPLYTHSDQAKEWKATCMSDDQFLPLASRLLYRHTTKDDSGSYYNTTGMMDDGRSVDFVLYPMNDTEEDENDDDSFVDALSWPIGE